MRKFFKQFGVGTLIAFTVCAGKVAVAGERGGNGGDALVCPGGIILLDSYEASQRDWQLNLEGETLREKVYSSLDRLRAVESGRAYLLSQYAEEILGDLQRHSEGKRTLHVGFTKGNLVDVSDSNELELPSDCTKVQLVIQKIPNFPEDRRYTVQEDLWKKMDLDQKAMTILHEIWYRLSLELNARDSVSTRYLNGFFARSESKFTSLEEHLQNLKRSKEISNVAPVFYYACDEGFAAAPVSELLEKKKVDLEGPTCKFFERSSQAPMKVHYIRLDGNAKIMKVIGVLPAGTHKLQNGEVTLEATNYSELDTSLNLKKVTDYEGRISVTIDGKNTLSDFSEVNFSKGIIRSALLYHPFFHKEFYGSDAAYQRYLKKREKKALKYTILF